MVLPAWLWGQQGARDGARAAWHLLLGAGVECKDAGGKGQITCRAASQGAGAELENSISKLWKSKQTELLWLQG